MSEKNLRDALEELTRQFNIEQAKSGGDKWPVINVHLERTGWTMGTVSDETRDAIERAKAALAEAGEPEMVRLLLMLHALEGTNRGFAEYYEEQGHYIVAKQKTIRADTYLHIKDIIQDEFGYKLEAEE